MCESSAVGCLGAADDASGRATVQSVSEFGLYEWVCNEHKIQVMRQEKKKKKSLSWVHAGASWHSRGTRCQRQSRNLLSGPVTLFPELKTGSGLPGINSPRPRRNSPSPLSNVLTLKTDFPLDSDDSQTKNILSYGMFCAHKSSW